MQQDALFYEDELDALKEAVRALGGPKVVGPWFHPEKPVEAASRAISDAMNPNRAERLTLGQVMLIMRRAREKGVHAPWAWICREVGYQAIAIEPDDEKAQLQREYIEAVNRLERIASRMDRTAPVAPVWETKRRA